MRNKNFPIKDYKGTHWTQRPENKARVAELAKKRSKMKAAAKIIAGTAKRGPYKKRTTRKFGIVRILDWRITFEGDEIKIERV